MLARFVAFVLVLSSARFALADEAVPVSHISGLQKRITSTKWPAQCDVIMKELVYIKVPYWGFDEKSHVGELIVNKIVADELIDIFNILYQNKFPIETIKTIDHFNNDDNASMEANNTSSFNCREKTGKPGEFSKHSFGLAIDINPKLNPYVKDEVVFPENGKPYVNRQKGVKGMILKDSLIYQLFKERGWKWGGEWQSLKDYQHFEKD